MREVNRIAYLAPEIPGPSSTFVYNEIFALEDSGVDIVPFSVHGVDAQSLDGRLLELSNRTTYLYDESLKNIFFNSVEMIFSMPRKYINVAAICVSDSLSLWRKPKLAAGQLFRFFQAVKLAAHLKNAKVEHLHVHFAHVPADIGMYAAMLCDVPFSVTAHANDIFQRGYLLPEKVARSKFTATISDFNVLWFTNLGAPKKNLRVVRCGVDRKMFSPRTPKRRQRPVVFGFLGRLVEKKGVDLLLHAAQELLRDAQVFKIELVGSGELEADLKEAATRLGVNDVIRFVGSLPHNEVAAWLENLDYFVLPCKKDSKGDMDGIPVALMEAMLKNVPVISTDISGIPELVIDKITGLTSKPCGRALANVMRDAINESTTEVEKRLKAAESLIFQEYDSNKNVAHLKKFFEN